MVFRMKIFIKKQPTRAQASLDLWQTKCLLLIKNVVLVMDSTRWTPSLWEDDLILCMICLKPSASRKLNGIVSGCLRHLYESGSGSNQGQCGKVPASESRMPFLMMKFSQMRSKSVWATSLGTELQAKSCCARDLRDALIIIGPF